MQLLTRPQRTHPYVSRFAANNTFAKEKGRVQEGWKLAKKNALCGKSFQPEEMGFFWSPTNPPLTIAQRIICLTCQTSDLWHFHMKWSYLWFRITPVRHLRLENNKKKWHLEFLFYFALICGIHELVEPKKVIFSLIKFLRDCMRGFIFLFYLTKPTKHSQKKFISLWFERPALSSWFGKWTIDYSLSTARPLTLHLFPSPQIFPLRAFPAP